MGGGSVSPTLLALDTSISTGGVAIGRGATILAARTLEEGRRHASHLIPAIAEVLEETGITRHEIDGVVVGKGPGSFTGVRIAAATVRGLARGLGGGEGRPLWGWSSLAGAAASGEEEIPEPLRGAPRCILFDARGDRVYAACYRFAPDPGGKGAGMETLLAPRAATVHEVLALDLPPDTLFLGDGALAHFPHFEERGLPVLPPPTGIPSGEGLLRVHALHPDAPPSFPEDRWEPEYLRGSSAERAP